MGCNHVRQSCQGRKVQLLHRRLAELCLESNFNKVKDEQKDALVNGLYVPEVEGSNKLPMYRSLNGTRTGPKTIGVCQNRHYHIVNSNDMFAIQHMLHVCGSVLSYGNISSCSKHRIF